ncbi:MAG: hypothetical protein ACRDTC_08865 [Pseudonocardiaceae bacterium]
MAGKSGDEVEVLIEVQDCQADEFGGRRDQQVWYRGCAVLSAVSQEREYFAARSSMAGVAYSTDMWERGGV